MPFPSVSLRVNCSGTTQKYFLSEPIRQAQGKLRESKDWELGIGISLEQLG
jgi:hypothetical protein